MSDFCDDIEVAVFDLPTHRGTEPAGTEVSCTRLELQRPKTEADDGHTRGTTRSQLSHPKKAPKKAHIKIIYTPVQKDRSSGTSLVISPLYTATMDLEGGKKAVKM